LVHSIFPDGVRFARNSTDRDNIGNVIVLRLSVLLILCGLGLADDMRLDALRSSMIGMRGKPSESGGPRGATPQLTVAKHQLRDWVESRLTAFTERGDEREFERKLNSELREAKLLYAESAGDQGPSLGWTLLGFLEDLKFRRSSGFLILQTGVGIECGFDESAYLYSLSDEGWKRVWQAEQNTYTKKAYKPQRLHAVLISPYNHANDYLVLTLGTEPWCASNWHDVYYRAFRLGPDQSAAPLVAGAEWAYLGVESPIQGSVARDDVLVEFTVGSIDGGVHSRKAVRHYKIDGGDVKRTDPLALSPRDFVDEWLTHGWKEAAFWSESANRGSMRSWHTKLHKDFVSGEFIYPTMHCPAMPDLWRLGVDFSDPPTPIGVEPKGIWFLVRWRPPFRFTMVDVTEHPSPACTEEDRKADEDRTLFPVRDWP
jgi:hypothetical protein